MEMVGEQRIAASRTRVWAALNDPEVLRQCIPGCQSLEMIGADRMRAVAQIKVGPIGAKFTGEVTLSELDPPNGYRISGEGQGGVAGFAKGGALVRLRDDGDATLLSYEVSAQVGGRLAQLGGAIIQATAKQMAAAFFKKLSAVIKAADAPDAADAAPTPAPMPVAAPILAPVAATAPAGATSGLPTSSLPMAWILAVVVAALAGFLLGRGGSESASAWAGLAIGLLVIVVAAAAFEFGRRTLPAPVVMIDPALLARLTGNERQP